MGTGFRSPWKPAAGLATVAALAALSGAIPAAVTAAAATPESRLYDVWLDLRLVSIFYPATTPASLPANLHKVAHQLKQPQTRVFFGERARDTLRFPPGAVVIDRHPPAETFILYARAGEAVWKLVDDPAGHLTLSRIARP